VLDYRGEVAGEALLSGLFQALEVGNVGVICLLAEKGALSIDRGAVRDVTLSKDARIGLCQVLRALYCSVPFCTFLR
jgi:hypothetical protein